MDDINKPKRGKGRGGSGSGTGGWSGGRRRGQGSGRGRGHGRGLTAGITATATTASTPTAIPVKVSATEVKVDPKLKGTPPRREKQLTPSTWPAPGTFSSITKEIKSSPNFACEICSKQLCEPTSAHCGHTFCRLCILDKIEHLPNPECPKCSTMLDKDKIFPNYALIDVIEKSKEVRMEKTQKKLGESTFELLQHSLNKPSNFSLEVLNRAIEDFETQRGVLVQKDVWGKTKPMKEFLGYILSNAESELQKLSEKIDIVNKDLSLIRDYEKSASSPPKSSQLAPVATNKMEEDDASMMLLRRDCLLRHFKPLAKIYFETRKPPVPVCDQDLCEMMMMTPGNVAQWEKKFLEGFENSLNQIIQYHSVRPLATFDCVESEELKTLKDSENSIVSSIEFDKDAEFFAVAGVARKIKIYDYNHVLSTAAGIEVQRPSVEMDVPGKVSSIAWNAIHKNQMASGDYDGVVTLWDVSRKKKLGNRSEHQERVWSVDWAKDGNARLFASGSDDGTVKLWSANDKDKSIATICAPRKAKVYCVQFAPDDSHYIAMGTADHSVYIYDTRQAKVAMESLRGHGNNVSHVRFCCDDELVSASTDATLKLWKVFTGGDGYPPFEKSFSGHKNLQHFTGLSTNGNYFACGSENNCVYFYHKMLTEPLFYFSFDINRSMPLVSSEVGPGANNEFVSAVAWKKNSASLVAANSQGKIKILQLL